MAQYIDKETLENILRRLWKEDDGKNLEHRIYYNKALQEVQCEIDSLEVKEVDLKKEIDKELDRNWYGEYINLDKFRESAKHFFELGLKVQKGE